MDDYDREARAALTSEANPFNAESIIRHHKARAEAAEADLRESEASRANLREALERRTERMDEAEAALARVREALDIYRYSHHPLCLQERGIADCNCIVADIRAALADPVDELELAPRLRRRR